MTSENGHFLSILGASLRSVITGGAGFLGSHLADYLLSKGHEVVLIDNLVTGAKENIAHLEGNPKATFVEADICDPFDVAGPVDFVFNFASPASPIDFDRIPIEVMKVGSYGTHNCLELARRKGARFFMASTSEVYGDPHVHPQPESYWGNVNPIGPRSVYDEAKRYSEAITMAYRRHYGLDTRIVRFFNTFGPRMRLDDGRVIPNFITQALSGKPLTVYGDGMQTRSLGYYRDIIEGVYLLATSDYQEPVNLGTHDEYTMKDLATLIIELTNSSSVVAHLPELKDDPKQRRPDTTRAQTILGWSPKTPLAQSLGETIEFFRGKMGA